MFDKEYYLEYFRSQAKHEPAKVNYYYAYDLITTGLKAKFGDNAVWLSEYQHIVDWLNDSKGYGLLVTGDSGLGKSVICRDIIPAILNEQDGSCSRITCLVTTAYNLATDGDELNLYSPKFIMIDDIGTEGEFVKFGAHRNMFMEVVDFAESNGKVLILTSNLTIKQLTEKYGERTVDRLKNICWLVKIEGESLRSGRKGGNGIPEKFRTYGMDFNSKEEADAFEKEQLSIKDKIDNNVVEVCNSDKPAYREGQPMKIVWNPDTKNNMAYALLKHDWNKYYEYVKKREEEDKIPF